MTTVGYGVSDNYMNGCFEGMLVVTLQSILSVVMGAVVVGGFWLRISRVQVRASTVVFSDKAVVQEIRGSLYFMFQVCDLRKHQLVEARVRCYTLQQKPAFSAKTMRLQRPDDQLNSLLLLAVPAVVRVNGLGASRSSDNKSFYVYFATGKPSTVSVMHDQIIRLRQARSPPGVYHLTMHYITPLCNYLHRWCTESTRGRLWSLLLTAVDGLSVAVTLTTISRVQLLVIVLSLTTLP